MPSTRPLIPNLVDALQQLLAQIPHGQVTTYGALARALGHVAAAKWIGAFLRNHPHDERCTCHRVVRKSGDIGVYGRGDAAEKIRRLSADGVIVRDGMVDLDQFGVDDFECDGPLRALTEFQETLPRRVRLDPLPEILAVVAGVDVSYFPPDGAVAAYVAVECETGEVVSSVTVTRRVRFPYITGFLAFREVPVHRELLAAVGEQGPPADVLLVDGNGILHPRKAGIATHLGIVEDIPTIGIGKKLLCGRVDVDGLRPGEQRPVLNGDNVIGTAVRSESHSRPIFVSPGHRVDVDGAARIVQHLFRGHRLPEPLHQADALSRRLAKDRR